MCQFEKNTAHYQFLNADIIENLENENAALIGWEYLNWVNLENSLKCLIYASFDSF